MKKQEKLLVVEIGDGFHKEVKMAALQAGFKLKDYVRVSLIERMARETFYKLTQEAKPD